jgi:hypothetical protein
MARSWTKEGSFSAILSSYTVHEPTSLTPRHDSVHGSIGIGLRSRFTRAAVLHGSLMGTRVDRLSPARRCLARRTVREGFRTFEATDCLDRAFRRSHPAGYPFGAGIVIIPVSVEWATVSVDSCPLFPNPLGFASASIRVVLTGSGLLVGTFTKTGIDG